MKKYLYLIKNSKIPTYLKYWLMYSSKKISLLMQSLPITLENTIKDLKIVINKIYGNTIQDGKPSPTNEVPINNVTGDVEVVVQNKNLFNKNNVIDGYRLGRDGINFPNTGYSVTDFIKVKPNTNFYRNKDITTMEAVCLYDKDKNFILRLENGNAFTTTENTYYIKTDVENIHLDTTQLEVGSTATPYTPHKEQVLPLTLGNIELCKIGDYQDSIVKDNGKWYLNKQIGKVVLDGSENWALNSSSGDSYRYWLNSLNFTNIFTNIISGGEAQLVGKLLCNYFTQKIFEQTYIGAFSINVGTSNNKWFLLNVSETSLENFKNWLNEHNTKVYYTLATATNTEITDTTLINQLNALEQAYSYEEVTNISSNQNIYLDIDYIKRG